MGRRIFAHTNWAAIRIITRNRSREGSCVAWSDVPWQQKEGIKNWRYFLHNIHFLYVIFCWALTSPKPPWALQVLFPGKPIDVIDGTVEISWAFCWCHQNTTLQCLRYSATLLRAAKHYLWFQLCSWFWLNKNWGYAHQNWHFSCLYSAFATE